MAGDNEFNPTYDPPASAYPGGNAPFNSGTNAPGYYAGYYASGNGGVGSEAPVYNGGGSAGAGAGAGAGAVAGASGAAGGTGFDPSDIFIGGDDNVYGTKRTYSTDPATGKTVYGYETVLLGPRSNLAAVSAASGIPVAALQSTPAFLSGRVTVDPDGRIWTQSGNGVRTPVTEQQILSGQIPGVTAGDLAAARSQALESQRTLAQGGQYTYGGMDPKTGQVMLRKGDGSLVPYVAGQSYAGLDLSEVQRGVQQANDQNFQGGSFSMPGTAGYQPGQSFNASQIMYGGSGNPGGSSNPVAPAPDARSGGGSSLTTPQPLPGPRAAGQPSALGISSAYNPGQFASPSATSASGTTGSVSIQGTPDSRGGGVAPTNPWAGLTNQQAQQTANQAQTGKTLSLIGKYGNITAGPNGSYSGTDFYGGHQQLSADQLTGSGSATAGELYSAQSDYSRLIRQQQQALRASTSRYLSGYDPNQVHSSVAGM